VQALLVAHPEGAQAANNTGCLPLHLAARVDAPQGVVEALELHRP
jgi:hypothetical protein